jgi:hypothetical protein
VLLKSCGKRIVVPLNGTKGDEMPKYIASPHSNPEHSLMFGNGEVVPAHVPVSDPEKVFALNPWASDSSRTRARKKLVFQLIPGYSRIFQLIPDIYFFGELARQDIGLNLF